MAIADTVINVSSLKKTFSYGTSSLSILASLIGLKPLARRTALRDISFSLKKGESVAIIGQNGAGKSTLLKILTGVMLPSAGTIEINGKIVALLELGAGFDHRLTGRQNIYANATLLGLTKSDIIKKEADIIAFSELGAYIDDPIRTYSSGMVMRLGFAIAINTSPTCFIIDEALSVGDISFQQKCLLAIEQYRKSGGSLLFVSHDFAMVKRFCDRALVLHNGSIIYDGDASEAIRIYSMYACKHEVSRTKQNLRYGIHDVAIESVAILVGNNTQTSIVSGSRVTLKVVLFAKKSTGPLSLGFLIKDRLGIDVYGTNSYLRGVQLNVTANERVVVKFDFTITLGAGKYTLTLGLHDVGDYTDNVQDWIHDVLTFEVLPNPNDNFVGVAGQIFHSISIDRSILPHSSTQL